MRWRFSHQRHQMISPRALADGTDQLADLETRRTNSTTYSWAALVGSGSAQGDAAVVVVHVGITDDPIDLVLSLFVEVVERLHDADFGTSRSVRHPLRAARAGWGSTSSAALVGDEDSDLLFPLDSWDVGVVLARVDLLVEYLRHELLPFSAAGAGPVDLRTPYFDLREQQCHLVGVKSSEGRRLNRIKKSRRNQALDQEQAEGGRAQPGEQQEGLAQAGRGPPRAARPTAAPPVRSSRSAAARAPVEPDQQQLDGAPGSWVEQTFEVGESYQHAVAGAAGPARG